MIWAQTGHLVAPTAMKEDMMFLVGDAYKFMTHVKRVKVYLPNAFHLRGIIYCYLSFMGY